MVERQRRGPAQGPVVAVHRVEHGHRVGAPEGHERALVGLVERRGRAQAARQPAEHDDVGVVDVHEAGHAPGQAGGRGTDGGHRVLLAARGPREHRLGVGAGVLRRRRAQAAGERPAVDLRAPAPRRPARAGARRVAEGEVAVLPRRAVRPQVRAAVEQQRPAEPDLDGEVERRARAGGRAGAGLGHPGERRVVADLQRHGVGAQRGGDRAEVDGVPGQLGRPHEAVVGHGRGGGEADRHDAVSPGELGDGGPQGVRDGRGVAAVAGADDVGDLAVEAREAHPPVLVAHVHRDHARAVGAGVQAGGGTPAALDGGAALGDPAGLPQPPDGLGDRRAGQREAARELDAGQARRAPDLGEHLRLRAPPVHTGATRLTSGLR